MVALGWLQWLHNDLWNGHRLRDLFLRKYSFQTSYRGEGDGSTEVVYIMICGSGTDSEISLCGSIRPPLMYSSSLTMTSSPSTLTFSIRAFTQHRLHRDLRSFWGYSTKPFSLLVTRKETQTEQNQRTQKGLILTQKYTKKQPMLNNNTTTTIV